MVSVGSLASNAAGGECGCGNPGTDAVNVDQFNAGLSQANAYTDHG